MRIANHSPDCPDRLEQSLTRIRYGYPTKSGVAFQKIGSPAHRRGYGRTTSKNRLPAAFEGKSYGCLDTNHLLGAGLVRTERGPREGETHGDTRCGQAGAIDRQFRSGAHALCSGGVLPRSEEN